MTSTVQKIRIPDLCSPVLTSAQRRALDEAQGTPVELTVDAVLAAASERVQLDDFGPDDFRERLGLLLEVVAWEGHTGLIQASTFRRMVNKAVDRLLTLDLLGRHPEIRDEPIDAPLIVAGLPRSGTTHLLNLIAADSRFHSTPFWQVLRPVPFYPEDAPNADGVDPRWLRAADQWERTQLLDPYAISMHPMDPDHISEDGELQMADFSSYAWEFSLHAAAWRDYYYAHDQTPHYLYEKTMLQIFQWQRGERKRWIVKAPSHFEQLGPIMKVFPDAILVFTHRDPVASLQSVATMFTYNTRTRQKRVDPAYDLVYWTERLGHLLDRYMQDINLVPKQQQCDCIFRDFMRDDIATVERIYQTANLEMTPRARGELERYSAGHQRGVHGQVVYDLRGDYGADPAELRKRYSDYTAVIPVGVEVK